MSNVCPRCLKSAIGLTEFGPDFDKDWTDSVHDLLLDRDWTESGQMLDKDWILRPTSVQPHFSNKHHSSSLAVRPSLYWRVACFSSGAVYSGGSLILVN